MAVGSQNKGYAVSRTASSGEDHDDGRKVFHGVWFRHGTPQNPGGYTHGQAEEDHRSEQQASWNLWRQELRKPGNPQVMSFWKPTCQHQQLSIRHICCCSTHLGCWAFGSEVGKIVFSSVRGALWRVSITRLLKFLVFFFVLIGILLSYTLISR